MGSVEGGVGLARVRVGGAHPQAGFLQRNNKESDPFYGSFIPLSGSSLARTPSLYLFEEILCLRFRD